MKVGNGMDARVAETVEHFFAQYPAKLFAAREQLIAAQDPPAGIFYLVSGQVRQYDITVQGEEIVVNVFKAAAFFPMAWAMTGTPNRYFFEAAGPVEVRVAPAADVLAFVRSHGDVLYDLLTRVYSGVEGLQRRMAHLMGGSARTLLLFELIVQCKRFGARQADGSYQLPLHEDELARRAGLTRETVSRELADLKRQGLVRVSRRGLTVRHLEQLEGALGDGL